MLVGKQLHDILILRHHVRQILNFRIQISRVEA